MSLTRVYGKIPHPCLWFTDEAPVVVLAYSETSAQLQYNRHVRYKELFTPHHIAVLVDWLEEKPDLCVEIYHPHGGGGPSYYTIHSLGELKGLIEPINWPEIQVTIWKNRSRADFESDESGKLETFASDLKWIYFHADEVMYFSVQKNRNWSESYTNHPDKYAKYVEDWNS
jgi:hypothetical protein